MNTSLLSYLCDPETRGPLALADAEMDDAGRVIRGRLVAESGRTWPIENGIPRFVDASLQSSVTSFGDEWNTFNYTAFKANWLSHTIANTFGSTEVFRDKVVIDAGGGSGAQTVWMLESGARHVILLELSHAVDGVIRTNIAASQFRNVDVIQCSIDRPPIRPQSIDGIVLCHNVIQHTPSVEKTAGALFDLVAPGGEFVFNCYPKNDQGLVRWIRAHLISDPLRAVLSRSPFWVIHLYSRIVALGRLVPVIGDILEKAGIVVQGEVPKLQRGMERLRHRYRSAVLNTFDKFGSHAYQHLKSEAEIRSLVTKLQPDASKVLNLEPYFRRPTPIGCAIRIFR